MAAHRSALQHLGLSKVWASLHKLALAGGRSVSRASQHHPVGTPGAGSPAVAFSAPSPVPVAPVGAASHEQLPTDVVALQQRVQQYKAKCKQLKVSWRQWRGVGEGVACVARGTKRCTIVRPRQTSRSVPTSCRLVASLPQATVVAMEGAAARWQSQAGDVEQGLALLRFR